MIGGRKSRGSRRAEWRIGLLILGVVWFGLAGGRAWAQARCDDPGASSTSSKGGASKGGKTAVDAAFPARQRRALLIAVQMFHKEMRDDHFKPLEFPVRDAVLMADALATEGGFTDVRVLANRTALKKLRDEAADALERGGLSAPAHREALRIKRTAEALLSSSGSRVAPFCVSPDATLLEAAEDQRPRAEDIEEAVEQFTKDLNEEDEGLVYASTHGFRARRPKGSLLDVGEVVLVSADTRIRSLEPRLVWENGYKMSQLLEALEGSDCKRLVVIQAACASSSTLNSKGGGADVYNQKIADRDSASVTVIGAAREFAYETSQVRGDYFTWFFRLAMTGRLGEIGPEWGTVDPDADGDGAISVYEAFDVAEVGVRRATALSSTPQVPYIIGAGNQRNPFILSGTPREVEDGVVYPRLPPRLLKGQLKNKTLAVRARGAGLEGGVQTLEGPTKLPPGIYHLELIESEPPRAADGSAMQPVRDRLVGTRRVQVPARGHVRLEEVWRDPWRTELSMGIGQWLGPSAWPEGDARAGNLVWLGAMLEVGAARDLLNTRGDVWSVQGGIRLQLGSSAPYVPGALNTVHAQAGVSPEVSVRRELYGRLGAELDAGVHGTLFLLNSYAFRKSMLVPGPGLHLGLAWDLGARQRVALRWAATFVYADLDCQPAIQDWDPEETSGDVELLQSYLETRCAVGADGRYEVSPSIYALSQLQAGWQWRF